MPIPHLSHKIHSPNNWKRGRVLEKKKKPGPSRKRGFFNFKKQVERLADIRLSPRRGGFNFNPGYFVPTYEVIYLIAKPKFRLAPKANAHGDVWEFTQEMNNEHPAAFPVALIDRIVSATTAKHILDPLMGSGTTAISALNHGRQYIGIELSPEYCDMANKRIADYRAKARLF